MSFSGRFVFNRKRNIVELDLVQDLRKGTFKYMVKRIFSYWLGWSEVSSVFLVSVTQYSRGFCRVHSQFVSRN